MRTDLKDQEAHSLAVAEIIREMSTLARMYGSAAMIEGASRFMGAFLSRGAKTQRELAERVGLTSEVALDVGSHHLRRKVNAGPAQGLQEGDS